MTACSSSQPANTTANTAQTQPQTAKNLESLTPTQVLKEFFEASKRKDIATVKKSLSKNSFPLIEKNAELINVSVDEYLRETSAIRVENDVETRNEKISGETATVEFKDTSMEEWQFAVCQRRRHLETRARQTCGANAKSINRANERARNQRIKHQ